MSVNGENGENGGGEGLPPEISGGGQPPTSDVIAQAEAAAEEARLAAEAARAKAEALAQQKPAKPAAAAESVKPATNSKQALRMVPNPDGLFDPTVVDEKAAEGYIPEVSVIDDSKARKIGFALFMAVVAVIGVATILVATSSEASTRMGKFFRGFECGDNGRANCLVEHIEGEARRREAEWRDEDYRARPIYGDITLTYFPKDARVDIYQKLRMKDGKEWRADTAGLGNVVTDCAQLLSEERKKQLSAGGFGDATCNESGEVSLPNQSQKLAQGEYVERLPLKNLPIFTTERHPLCEKDALTCDLDTAGSVKVARNFDYRIVFTREGYEPHEIVITREGWTKGAGASNYIYFWNGLDLQPKPETLRDNFIRARGQLFCLMKIQKLETYEKLPVENRDLIMSRTGFKDWDSFIAVEQVLTTGEFEAWWTEAWTEIQKQECGPATP